MKSLLCISECVFRSVRQGEDVSEKKTSVSVKGDYWYTLLNREKRKVEYLQCLGLKLLDILLVVFPS